MQIASFGEPRLKPLAGPLRMDHKRGNVLADSKDRAPELDSRPSTPPRARVVALYLPQFHPIPENDEFWGHGFTEWTNVARARPLYRGHVQPNLPGELGFYDLRLPETRERQAELAQEHGVEAFCYWYYWFAGRKVLQRPLEEVIASGRPRFPFCIGWANHSWTGVWIGAPENALIEQTYPGIDDYKALFRELLPAFRDERYLRVDGRLVFVLFRPFDLPSVLDLTSLWRELLRLEGLGDFHFVGVGGGDRNLFDYGLDGAVDNWVPERYQAIWRRAVGRLLPALKSRIYRPSRYDYSWYSERMVRRESPRRPDGWLHPHLLPNWDNTPRAGTFGVVLEGSTPELFGAQVRGVMAQLETHAIPPENRLVFLKSWNEWAEGNYMEPDRQWGRSYLEALRAALFESA